MKMEQALQTFFGESRELLDDMEKSLLALGGSGDISDEVNAIFRAAHTIKGSAGLFGLDKVVNFTHVVESLLDQMRDGRCEFSDELIASLLASRDHIGRLLDEAAGDLSLPKEEMRTSGEDLLKRLRDHFDCSDIGGIGVPSGDASICEKSGDWHISLRFQRDTLRHGMDPLSFLHFLGKLGDIVHIVTLADAMPADEAMEPEACYLGFEIVLRGQTDLTSIDSVFEFVRDDCDIHILEPGSDIDAYDRLIQMLPEDVERLRPIMDACRAVTARVPAPPSALVPDSPVTEPAFGTERPLSRAGTRSIRVEADRLDRLIDQIGELIIVAAGASLVARQSRDTNLQERTAALDGLVQAVRESALQLRMVKIAATFNRFQRVVHDTARECGKDIRLLVRGEDTELDKTVVEKITDPITHLVRNAIDHGIESSERRVAAGKPAQGTVRLDAWHDSGSIVICVSDDGGGLDRGRILSRAVERGLIEADRQLADSEVYELIFEPGFSTAEKVTNLSGRGVGMDVVKRNIEGLRGSIQIDSTPGAGTAISIRLPLTLAIIDGFLVRVGDSVFVVPLDVIEECIEFAETLGSDYTNLRGQVLPFIRLRELFDIKTDADRRQSIVVIKHAGHLAGLVVDALLGEFQTVIKPLGKVFGGLKCISGSTVLGNGKVALILDVPALVARSGSTVSVHQKSVEQAIAAH